MIAAGIVALILVIVGLRSVTVVPDDSAYIVERLGKYHRTLPSGLQVLTPFIDRVAFRYSLLPQSVKLSDVCITLDNVCIGVNSTFQWQVVDPQQAAYGVASEEDFIVNLVRSSQRQWISERPWSEIRETTRELQQAVLRAATEPAARIGVKIAALSVERMERTAAPA